MLAAGTGLVQMHRGSVPTATQLWITPGVREWVDGAAVSCGETLELLSTPQMSEEEGEFVRVRRATERGGQEGWAKMKNIRAADWSP